MLAQESIDILQREIMPLLAPDIRNILSRTPTQQLEGLEEIRIRSNQPLLLRVGNREFGVESRGGLSTRGSFCAKKEDVMRTIAAVSDNSIYAFEEDIKKGFITVPGGHRVGLAGQVVMQSHQIKTVKDFSGVCIRVAREVKGCANDLMHKICFRGKLKGNTLLVSPPRCGKTTLLRDIARQLSLGIGGYQGANVVIVDERSEIAGSYLGVSQLDVGPRTDVLDSCPKTEGIMMAVRSLAPDIIVTDEMGKTEDLIAVNECINAGVGLVSSVHAGSIDELERRLVMTDIMNSRAFHFVVLLSRRNGPGTIEKIIRWG